MSEDTARGHYSDPEDNPLEQMLTRMVRIAFWRGAILGIIATTTVSLVLDLFT